MNQKDGATRLFYPNCRWISLEHCVDHLRLDLINELTGGGGYCRFASPQTPCARTKIAPFDAGDDRGLEFFLRDDHAFHIARSETALAQN